VTTQLPERLRELAGDAPPALSARDLWQTGRRRHRLRVAAALGTAACLVMVTALLGNGAWRSHQPSPAAPPATTSGPMAIPQPLFNPSPWLSGTSSPGRLVALLGSTRDHLPVDSEKNALVGVTAGSQAYHFLDLPGRARDATDAALSPDGLHLAYWVDGPGTDGTSIGQGAVTGVAVLDLVSGAVERHVVLTQHGLAAGTLSWVDPSTVAMTAAPIISRGAGAEMGPLRGYELNLGVTNAYSRVGGQVREVPVTSTLGFAAMVGAHRLRMWNRLDASYLDLRLSEPIRGGAYDGRRHLLAAVAGNPDHSGRTSQALVVGRAVHGRVHLTSIPGARTYANVLTWVDRDHVATVRQTRNGLVYDVVDVRTGARRELTHKPWYAFTVARDALRQATTVPGIEPPHPWNPRWVVGGTLVVLILVGGAVLLLVRRSSRVGR
jgi:hypothetical protein